jgi:hypothetical protein
MDETIRQIEGEIDRSRAELGSHLRELEARVDAATDWREHVRARPYAAAGVAVATGLVLGQWIGHRQRKGRLPREPMSPREPTRSAMSKRSIDASGQAYDLFEKVANAMIAVAAGRLTQYLGGLVPGFSEEFRRVEAKGRGPSSTVAAPDVALT